MACPKVNYDQRMMSQFDSRVTSAELQRRESAHQEAAKQEDIAAALELVEAMEPILSRLNLYYCGELRELKETLEGMR